MKRITTLMLVLTLMLGSISIAKAEGIDVKVKGQWYFAFGWADNMDSTGISAIARSGSV